MTPAARDELRWQLIHDEGVRLKPYRDTVGVLTIGVGRNLDHVGITREEALMLLEHDLDRTINELVQRYPWFTSLDPVRQVVLANMAFNLGLSRLSLFVNTLAAIQRGDYAAASRGMLASKWARQVGARADRLAGMMRSGLWTRDV